MTKEELKQEAEKSLDKRLGTYAYIRKQDCYTNYVDGYIDSAEPREKRIAELEDKLANADYQLEGRDNEIRELEAQIEKMKCCYNCSKWYDGECEESPKSKTFFCADFKCDNWEMFK
jgi:predicted ribonuclease toxin of YeeF-YezG toxin-antitoxin module